MVVKKCPICGTDPAIVDLSTSPYSGETKRFVSCPNNCVVRGYYTEDRKFRCGLYYVGINENDDQMISEWNQLVETYVNKL